MQKQPSSHLMSDSVGGRGRGESSGRVLVGSIPASSYRSLKASKGEVGAISMRSNGAANGGIMQSRGRPAWNSDIKDQSVYRLTRPEMLRKQAALSISHHHAFQKPSVKPKKKRPEGTKVKVRCWSQHMTRKSSDQHDWSNDLVVVVSARMMPSLLRLP